MPAKLSIYSVLIAAIYLTIYRFPFYPSNSTDINTLFPYDACRTISSFLGDRPPNFNHYTVLTHFNHGGWCRWFMYEHKPHIDIRVTTDGRTQNADVEFYKKSFNLFYMKKGWLDTLNEWSPDAALVPEHTPLFEGMTLLPAWSLLFENENFRVFVPTKSLTQP